MASTSAEANQAAYDRLTKAEPVLVEIRPAIEVVPGLTRDMVLTSGPPMAWSEYFGGQRDAVIGGALHEGLALTRDEAIAKFDSGDIKVSSCHEHDCIGSVAGIYTASMPVFVVEDRHSGARAFCNFYEGPSRYRLNYGYYSKEVHDNLNHIATVIAPVFAEAVRMSGGVPLKPLIQRALHMGDELHSRNTAATILFTRELFPALIEIGQRRREDVSATLAFIRESDYFFLRLSMAAAKATANSAHGIEASSVVSAMTISCRGFAIRVSGLGERWFEGPHATLKGRFFEGFTEKDVEWMGGESHHAEVVGLGGFAQAAAFGLQAYQGGTADAMIANNLAMYDITVGEHPDYRIPYFGFRGVPVGIDVLKVVETGIVPLIDGGLAGRGGGQIGAGVLMAPMECFEAAAAALARRPSARVLG
jgi:Protein of unknown function (DUF1116)